MRCAICMALQKANRQTLLGQAAITIIGGTAYCEIHMPKEFVEEHKGEEPVVRDYDGTIKPASEMAYGEELAKPEKKTRRKSPTKKKSRKKGSK